MEDKTQNVHLVGDGPELSPRQVARAIGVSESSLKRWCDRGLIPVRRTAGGHRKIAAPAVVRFLRDSGHDLARPELLGLPSAVGPVRSDDDAAVAELGERLMDGDEPGVRSVVLGLFLSRRPLDEIFDRVLAPSLHDLGHAWERDELEVYREHRAVEIVTRLLGELRSLIGAPGVDAPVAIGATLPGDPYTVAIHMAELVLRDSGWRAEALGPDHPVDTLIAAIGDYEPRLLWISVSHVPDQAAFLAGYRTLYEAARERGVAIVVGGQALDGDLRSRMRYAAFCETMGDLVGLADTLAPPH